MWRKGLIVICLVAVVCLTALSCVTWWKPIRLNSGQYNRPPVTNILLHKDELVVVRISAENDDNNAWWNGRFLWGTLSCRVMSFGTADLNSVSLQATHDGVTDIVALSPVRRAEESQHQLPVRRYPPWVTLQNVRCTLLWTKVTVPFICFAVAFSIYPFVVCVLRPLNRNRRRRRGLCPQCGYDLRGNAGRVCSECGAPVVLSSAEMS